MGDIKNVVKTTMVNFLLSKIQPEHTINIKYITTSFSGCTTPTISLFEYINRIDKYAIVYLETYIIATIYLQRLFMMHGNSLMNNKTMHRYLIIAIIIASKYNQDENLSSNLYYARVGGISLYEVNKLELSFLRQLNFELYISDVSYEMYHKILLCE